MDWGAAWKVAVRLCRGVSVKSACVNELAEVILVSLKGKGSVRMGILLSTNSKPSEKETRSGTIGPPKEILGVADFRPRRWPLRIRNSGNGSFRSQCHLFPPGRVSAVPTPPVKR